MKKSLLFLILGLALGASSLSAQISSVERSGSWYYVYNAAGKKIATLSSSVGELKGYSSEFFIVKNGSWYYLYNDKGKKITTLSASSVGEIIGVAGNTFTSRNGSWIYTYNSAGKRISTRAAR